MGLDMYLTGKRYMSKVFNEADGPKMDAIKELFPELANMSGRFGDTSPVKEVRIEAGYWRKANAVHQWFVQHVQGGEDECRPHYVSREQLQELKAQCEKVLAFRHLAVECMPTQGGFFFGSTEYDDYYFNDLEDTIKIIDRCLELPNDWDFEYCSSW